MSMAWAFLVHLFEVPLLKLSLIKKPNLEGVGSATGI